MTDVVEIIFDDAAFMAYMQQFAPDVAAAAEEVAANARRLTDMPVTVTNRQGNDGRPVSIVTIAHAGGLASQAKHGTLTRAAAQAGLDTKRY